jgi:hypothetical protein
MSMMRPIDPKTAFHWSPSVGMKRERVSKSSQALGQRLFAHKISGGARLGSPTPGRVALPIPLVWDSRQSSSTRHASRRARPIGVAEKGQEHCVGVGMRLGRGSGEERGLAAA